MRDKEAPSAPASIDPKWVGAPMIVRNPWKCWNWDEVRGLAITGGKIIIFSHPLI